MEDLERHRSFFEEGKKDWIFLILHERSGKRNEGSDLGSLPQSACDTKSSFTSALRQGTPPPRSVPCLNDSMPFPECSSDGRCACKDNVEGAGCDRCAEGTYGLGQDEHAVLNS